MAPPLRTWARHAASLGRARLAHLPVAASPALRQAHASRRWGSGGDVGRRWMSGRDPVDEMNEEFANVFGQHLGAAPGPGGSDSSQTSSGQLPFHESLRPAGVAEDFQHGSLRPAAHGGLAPAAQELSTTSEFARIVRRIDVLETLSQGGVEHGPGAATWVLGGRGARRLRAMALEKDERLRVLFAAYGAGEEGVLAVRCLELLEDMAVAAASD